jgi:hypothetical protein
MITIAHLRQSGDVLDEPTPLIVDHPFEVISLIAKIALPSGEQFTEVKENAIMMQSSCEKWSTITTYVGQPEEIAPIISFAYHYLTQAEKPVDLPVALMRAYVNERIAERMKGVVSATDAPPEEESSALRRAVLFGCGIVDEDDISVGLEAGIHCITMAALFAEEPGVSFLEELYELVNDAEFNDPEFD